MKLTVGQKNALIRKATEIINEKRAAEREKLLADYEIKDTRIKQEFDTYKELLKKFQRLIEYAKQLGYSTDYYYGMIKNVTIEGKSLKFVITLDDSISNRYKEELQDLKETEIRNVLDNKYPTYQSTQDEIELQTLSKDFDMEAFLDKYRNL